MAKRWNWEDLRDQAAGGEPFDTIKDLSDYIGVPYDTVYLAFQRGDIRLSGNNIGTESDDDGLRPVEITLGDIPRIDSKGTGVTKVLFITDPHFGHIRHLHGMETIHDRMFLSGLLEVARKVKPEYVIWNGDLLDLAEFSRWDDEPELMRSTQLAAIEASWVLGQFRKACQHQIVIEGNHDVRLQKSLLKMLKPAYKLVPADDLGGEPLLSIPRLLGLASIKTRWVGGYPDSYVTINGIRFSHGNAVRSGSGKTTTYLAMGAAGSHFFGHIHRHELAVKYLPELDKQVWIGSPGCACRKGAAPGSSVDTNWQMGAFLVHIVGADVHSVEHIAADHDGVAHFRGETLDSDTYMETFLDSLPAEYRRQLEY